MAGRRTVYALALLGGLVFYWAYREWLSWFVLMLLVFLPWFSLLMSLPAILSCKTRLDCPQAVARDAQAQLCWYGSSPYPLPRLTGRLTVQNSLTGESRKLRSGDDLPTEHCGQLTVTLRRPRCCDYLGLFVLPLRMPPQAQVLVRPTPLVPGEVPDMSRYQVSAWRPKPGGGFSENHELRLYRPGDSLKQVHWKLSAKTGKLITREPMEPVRSRMLLTLELRGTAGQLDTKLGKLLWMSRYLLECELPHQIQCLTGQGMAVFPVECPEDTARAVDALLRSAPAQDTTPTYTGATWRYHIGGEADA